MAFHLIGRDARRARAQDIQRIWDGDPGLHTLPVPIVHPAQPLGSNIGGKRGPFSTEPTDAHTAALKQAGDVGVLIFGSYRKPGGGWRNGAKAQEEDISLVGTRGPQAEPGRLGGHRTGLKNILRLTHRTCQNVRPRAIPAPPEPRPMKHFLLAALLTLSAMPALAAASSSDIVGEVKTSTNILGPNDTIGVIRFEDPKVAGAYCYLASAQKGGMAANFGLQESPSEYELSCFADGVVHIPVDLPENEIVDEANRSAVFKKMYVARFVDRKLHRLIYVAYTRYLLDGSPKHAMSSLPYTP